jgi:hypothetical protein
LSRHHFREQLSFLGPALRIVVVSHALDDPLFKDKRNYRINNNAEEQVESVCVVAHSFIRKWLKQKEISEPVASLGILGVHIVIGQE